MGLGAVSLSPLDSQWEEEGSKGRRLGTCNYNTTGLSGAVKEPDVWKSQVLPRGHSLAASELMNKPNL